jgi:hypothetical protein
MRPNRAVFKLSNVGVESLQLDCLPLPESCPSSMLFNLTSFLAAAIVLWTATLVMPLPLYALSYHHTGDRHLEVYQRSNQLEPIKLVPKVRELICQSNSVTHEQSRAGGTVS